MTDKHLKGQGPSINLTKLDSFAMDNIDIDSLMNGMPDSDGQPLHKIKCNQSSSAPKSGNYLTVAVDTSDEVDALANAVGGKGSD